MKLIKDKYKYPELQRVENEFGRFYIDSEGQEVPSVTNVLSTTSDQSGINEWKEEWGMRRQKEYCRRVINWFKCSQCT